MKINRNDTFRKIHRTWYIVAICIIACSTAIALLPKSRVNAPPQHKNSTPTPSKPVPPSHNTDNTPQPPPAPTQHSSSPSAPQPVQDDTSYHIVVNKKHPLNPLQYTPTDLTTIGSQKARAAVAAEIKRMQTDSGSDITITPASGYRSYDTQTAVYNGYVAQYGQASADTFSARPGYSEHQTGLAIDFSPIDISFANTPQFTWLQANAYRYGFILRYPEGKTDITGYTYEPWHWRYIGTAAATDMHTRGILTLEEYYAIPGGTY